MIYSLDASQCRNFDISSRREWLLTNGIGGYAMGTAAGVNTRRYHGLLVAADPAPAGRWVLLGNMEAHVEGTGNQIGISSNQYNGSVFPDGYQCLESFQVGRIAIWKYKVSGLEIEKRAAIHEGVNAVTLKYTNLGSRPFGLILKPLVQHKFYHDTFRMEEGYPQVQAYPKDRTVIGQDGRNLILRHDGAIRTPAVGWYFRFENLREFDRGLDGREDMFCPCELRWELLPGEEAVITASLNDEVDPIKDWEIGSGSVSVKEMLSESMTKFFVKTPGRTSIIAGYPWFTDWGRDTMISLPGVCLKTGRTAEARTIILDYASQMRQGLIPNRFVDKGEDPEYNTVDATLWFVNAMYQTLQAEWDEQFAKKCLISVHEVVDWHLKGTLYGIKVDTKDGLLTQGQEGVQLTWMDAKIGDWVVTPRHGKPVEINGLWISALRIGEWLADKLGQETKKFTEAAAKAEKHFEQRFWKETVGYYLDTAGPDDASLRPNQVIAMSVPFSPCDPEHAKRALEIIGRELTTQFGLRTLSTDSAAYHGQFKGPLDKLDEAYHQGTVWPWLMGPYITALVKFTGDKKQAKRLLKGARELLSEYGLGGIAEVYDGDTPRDPGGCPWQAWSAAEWLRAWVDDADGN